MYIDKEFAKFTNTKLQALKTCHFKRYVGEKLYFLHQYCILTNKEPELLKLVDGIIENNVEFANYSQKVRLGKGFSCYGWEATYYVASMNISSEQYEDIKKWYKRIHARKDSLIVDKNENTNNTNV